MAETEKILRACVHCGFCSATCPTYLLTGDELDGPRGPHLSHQGDVREGAPGRRAHGASYRSLSVLPLLHDDMSFGRAFHASRRSRAGAYRKNICATLRGARHARGARFRLAASFSRATAVSRRGGAAPFGALAAAPTRGGARAGAVAPSACFQRRRAAGLCRARRAQDARRAAQWLRSDGHRHVDQ